MNSINNPYDGPTWERMIAIKSRILRIWDSAAIGVRICCIKFAQRVVLVQTTGPDADAKVWISYVAIVPATDFQSSARQSSRSIPHYGSTKPPSPRSSKPRSRSLRPIGPNARSLPRESEVCISLCPCGRVLTTIAMPYLLMPL